MRGIEQARLHAGPKIHRCHAKITPASEDVGGRTAACAGDFNAGGATRPGLYRPGAIGRIGLGVPQHQSRHEVVERVGAEDISQRAGGGLVGDVAPSHRPLVRTGEHLAGFQVTAVTVVGIAETDIFDQPAGTVDFRLLEIEDEGTVFADHPPDRSLDEQGGVFVDAEAALHAGRLHGDDQPAEPAALDEMLVDHAPGKEPEPGLQQHSG